MKVYKTSYLRALLIWGAFFAPPAMLFAQGPYVKIVNRQSGLVLDLPTQCAGSTGCQIQQWQWLGGLNQQWTLVSVDGTYVNLVNRQSGMVLDLPTQCSDDNGCIIQQWTANGGPQQEWEIIPTSSGYYRIENKLSQWGVMDVTGGSTSDGTQIQQYQYLGGGNQQWAIVLVDPGDTNTVDESDAESYTPLIYLPTADASATGGCTDISGIWADQTTPSATWNITQTDDDVAGTVSSTFSPGCGTVTWTVTGTADYPGGSAFTLNASNPSPPVDACGTPAYAWIKEGIILNPTQNGATTYDGNANCVGSGYYEDPEKSKNAYWYPSSSAPNSGVPGSLTMHLEPAQIVSGQGLNKCNGDARSGWRWGIQQCINYTINDKGSQRPLAAWQGLSVGETVVVQVSNSHTGTRVAPAPIALINGPTFADQQTALSSIGTLNPAYREILFQTWTVYRNGTPVGPNPIRSNCILKRPTMIVVVDQTAIDSKGTGDSCNAQTQFPADVQ